MINSLFSSFDPSIRRINLNYFIILMIPTCQTLFYKKSRILEMSYFVSNKIYDEVTATLPRKNQIRKILIVIRIFTTVLFLNLMGLIPYVFTITAHLSVALSIILPFWLGFLIFRILRNWNHALSHLVPLSTPIFLSQFIVLIERVSQIIRPITLSVRLAANLTAGHILIALLRSTILIINPISFILIILIILELAVAIIQAYVITILVSIYLSEAYDKTISPLSYCLRKTLTTIGSSFDIINTI